MAWTQLWWGTHKGKTLPQIILSDPDWVFWAAKDRIFKNKGKTMISELGRVLKRARRIKIPGDGSADRVVEYVIHPGVKKLASVSIIKRPSPSQTSKPGVIHLNRFDMYLPHQQAPYDKKGNKIMIAALKKHIPALSGNFTKKKCEAFFDDKSNFDP